MYPLFARIIDGDAISLRNLAPGIEQRPVEVEGEQAYRHKESDKVKDARAEGKGDPAE